jgi:hypothetical protein
MENKVLYVFDMDDTLINVSGLINFIFIKDGNIETKDEKIKENVVKIKGFFSTMLFKELCFENVDDLIMMVDCQTKTPFKQQHLEFIKTFSEEKLIEYGFKPSIKKYVQRVIKEKNGILFLEPFPGFYEDEKTIGSVLNLNVFNSYKLAKNKMIISGRSENLRNSIKSKFEEIGIDYPNFGLFLFKGGRVGIADFKVNTIKNSILENNWNEIHFFEDKMEWLEKAFKEITSEFPYIKFHKHFVNK